MRYEKSLVANEMLTVISDFDIQTEHQITAKKTDIVIVNKKKKKKDQPNNGLCRSCRPQTKIERKRKEL